MRWERDGSVRLHSGVGAGRANEGSPSRNLPPAVRDRWHAVRLVNGLGGRLPFSGTSGRAGWEWVEADRGPLQLSIFLAIATVFAVHGTKYALRKRRHRAWLLTPPSGSSGIYAPTSYQLASGAGWLLLSIVDVRCLVYSSCQHGADNRVLQIVWLLFLTSEEDSFFLHLFNSTGAPFTRSGGPSSRRPQRSSSALGISSNGNGPVSYQGGAYAGVGGIKQSSLHEGMSADLSGNQEEGRHSPNMGTTGLLENQQRESQGGLKARALYSCESTF